MISNNAYYELFASYTVPDHNRVGYWVDLGANSKGKVIKTYNENLKKWVKVTDATSEDAVAPFIGNNGNWWIDNRDTGINASGHSPYIGDNSNWFVYSSERNEHVDTGLPSRGEAGPKGDKGDKGNDATINGVGSIKIEAGDNITITQSEDTLTIIGDVQKPDLSNYATKTEVTKLDNKLQDAVSSVFRAKGSVKTYNNLPVDRVSIGDVYNVSDTGANYVAISINPITWDKLSETVDLSKFFNKNEIDSLLSTKVDKQEGKQLTTEDFTTVLKRKLEGLSNYNDTEIRNAIDSLESAFNTLVEGNATVAIDTFNEIVAFLKNVENSQDLDSIIAGINTTISKVEAKIPDTNNFLSKDGGTMNNTNLVGNLNAELLNGYSSDKFVSIINHIKDSTTTDALTVGLNTINQDYLWTNTPYSDIATLVDMSYSPDWRSLFFISPSTGRIHTRFKHNGDTWTNWKEIAFTDGSVANADMLDGLHSNEFIIKGPRVYSKEDFDTKYRFASMYSTDYMSPVDGAYNYGQVLSFVDNCSTTQFYCPDNTGLIYFRNSWGTDSKGSENFANIPWYEIITSKNIGSQTVANADMLDWCHADNFVQYGVYPSGSNNNWSIQSGIYRTYDHLPNFPETPNTHGHFVLHANFDTNTAAQLLLYGIYRDAVYYRRKVNQEWLDWKRLAFTTDTVAAANKLSTIRYLWGRPFDGSGDVKGIIRGVQYVSFETYDYEGGSAGYVGRGGTNSNDLSITTYGENYIEFSTKSTERMRITKDGFVGIGTLTPVSELHVIGKSIFYSNEHYGNDGTIRVQNDYAVTGWAKVINACCPYMCNGANAVIQIGASDSEKNGGYIAYHYAGYKSDNNYMKIGLTAVDDILNVTANRRVGINTTTPQGTLNVDGDVVFENSRFITTSGFTDGDYAYSHAIYGGYHGIDVCEFYENEFRFKTNGGDITSFTLNRYYADFNGTVRTYNCDFTGVHWNGNTRFRLIRDGESSTWLQAGTDTTAENGDLYMSGLHGNLLRQFNVWTSVSKFKGSIIAEGDVTAYSDIRLKNRIESVNNVLDTIDTLDVFRYTWKDREDKSVHIGVSAQQVQNIYPEFVLTSSSEDGADYLTVNYAALATCVAIQGIKELAKKGDERDKRIAALEEEVISLKEQLRYGNK